MRLGIDFGTTRTVVAYADRGNYPILSFFDEQGDATDWFPSVIAESHGEFCFGFDALARASDRSFHLLRSFKRLLADPHAMPDRLVALGSTKLTLVELVTCFLGGLREALLTRSNLPAELRRDTVFEAVVATPANAHGAQRFITLDAFRRAGFQVLAMLNEPSAAGFEYTHRHRETLTAKRENVVVYDLGGGTFDASLVRMSGAQHDAIATAGINRLGGDDFDTVLVDLALQRAGVARTNLEERGVALLVERCREAKERLNPNSRKLTLDLEGVLGEGASVREVTVATSDYYAACGPMVERTIEAMGPVIARMDGDPQKEAALSDIAGIYVVGGASELPVIPRALRERFGRRVHRSPYPSAAIAIGLAIASDERSEFRLSDRFTRCFGVFREGEGGREVIFDPIFTRDTVLPQKTDGPLRTRRRYRAAHNIGHFRFLECSALGDDGTPKGSISPFADVLFPFEPTLVETGERLAAVPVQRLGSGGPEIQEEYRVDENGIVEVTIRNVDIGYERAYRLGA